MKTSIDYLLGLDIGTGSVGWAVTDENYELLKVNRKFTWGSVLFNTAKTAEERRVFRCARRRNKRVKERVKLLQMLLEEEINKVDSGFFLRLKESRYTFEDKLDKNGNKPELPYNLFVDKNYKDKDYYKEYPTIYHLRYALICENKKFDIRLIYLALEHILKHRGHFLSNIDINSIGNTQEFTNIFEVFIKMINEIYGFNILIDENMNKKAKDILKNNNYNKSKKQEEMLNLLNCKDKAIKELIKAMVGGKAVLKNIFTEKEIEEDCKFICFESSDYDENEEKYVLALGDDYELIAIIKSIYNWIKLTDILGKSKSGYISDAKIKLYDKHKSDLKILKAVVKKYLPNNYKKIFGAPVSKNANYSAYVGMVKEKGVKIYIENKVSKEDFYKFINKEVINKLSNIVDERIDYIKQEIENKNFLPKQKTSDNSIIPYQIHEIELIKILENASKHYNFFNIKDEEGISISDKIHSIMTFKIPYYIGPLNSYHSDKENGHAWIQRLEEGKIYPWNFEKKVDIETSATKFIQKMTNKCSYLKDEDVLPKRSLLYEKFMVLNELNNLKIKGEPIGIELKQCIYHKLFERHKKVTIKKLIDFLKIENYYDDISKEDISGINGDFTNGLISYMAFKELFTDCKLTQEDKEDIIKDITLFGSDEKLLRKRLNRKYPGNEKRIKLLVGKIKSDSWGRLSREFLEDEKLAIEIPGKGKIGTIIYQLWNTNNNLMQLLSKNFPYMDMIDKINGIDKIDKINYDLIRDVYVSPATKRQIWKSIQIIKEVERFMGKSPKRIFIEMAREKQTSKRSVTRKDQLLEKYKYIKKEEEYLFNQLLNTDNDKLRRDKLYLYYTQMGKCAYTGREIPLEELIKENGSYDIDHIYPQSKTADDSLDNRVLVYKPYNQDKNDIYPLDSNIRKKMYNTWNAWLKIGLISKEKYNRLIGTNELTNEQLMRFINRQLVETRQSTKVVTEILKKIMPDETEIVFVKAGNVSRFRRDFKLLKIREMNDFHHAKDAYLNIVVGNAYHLFFNKDIRKFFMERGTYRTYNLTKLFKSKDIIFKNECAWRCGEKGTIITVKNTMENNKVLISEQTYEQKGQLFDIMPLKKSKGQVPLKNEDRLTDIKKYGGYNSATIAYFSLIDAKNEKGNLIYILPIPLRFKYKYENDNEWANNFIIEKLGNKITFNKIIKKKLLFKTVFVYNGFKMGIAGKSGDSIVFHNKNQAIFNFEIEEYLKELFKFKNDLKEKKDVKINKRSKLNDKVMDNIFIILKDKLENTIYKTMYSGAITTIQKGEKIFGNLSLEDKAKALLEIFKLFQCTAEMPDFSLIGGKKMGAIRLNSKILDKKGMIIVNKSITGIYENIERIN